MKKQHKAIEKYMAEMKEKFKDEKPTYFVISKKNYKKLKKWVDKPL